MEHPIAYIIGEKARTDGTYAVAWGLLEVSENLERLARAVDRLGTNDAATPMGAIEMLAKELKDGLEAIATAVAPE